jgi:hypothetical protein
MLRIIALSLVLISPAYADVFSCVQPDGRTVLQSRPCKCKVVRSLPGRPATHRPEEMEFTNNKGQHCRVVPPSYVKLVCEERIEEPHVKSRGE